MRILWKISTTRLHMRLVLVLILLILGLVGLFLIDLASRPQWELSVSNTASGAEVVVTQEDSATPVYTVQLIGVSINAPISRRTRKQLQSRDVETTFFDDTIRPGRWTIRIHGITLDFMERGIDVNGTIHGVRGDVLTVEVGDL